MMRMQEGSGHAGGTEPVQPARIAGRAEAEATRGRRARHHVRDLEAVLQMETRRMCASGACATGSPRRAARASSPPPTCRGSKPSRRMRSPSPASRPRRWSASRRPMRRSARSSGTNQVVLATARAVSESLVKGIAEEMNRHARPQGYAPAGYGAGALAERAAGDLEEPVGKAVVARRTDNWIRFSGSTDAPARGMGASDLKSGIHAGPMLYAATKAVWD